MASCKRRKLNEEDKFGETLKAESLRQKLVLSLFSKTPIIIENIRSNQPLVGLRPYELNFISLLDKISIDSIHEINDNGTTLKYYPGIIVCGKNLVHDCGLDRSIGYFIESLIPLALFATDPLIIKLKGITNGSEDISVDTFSSTIDLLMNFRVCSQRYSLTIESRGVAPHGGGEVTLSIQNVKFLDSMYRTNPGKLQSIKCSAFSTRASSEDEYYIKADKSNGTRTLYLTASLGSRVETVGRPSTCAFKIETPRDMIRPLCTAMEDILRQHVASSSWYGVSLCAKTSNNCVLSADVVSSGDGHAQATNIGEEVVKALVEEIEKRVVVDTRHQGLLLLLCSMSAPYLSDVFVGELTPVGRETLKNIEKFLKMPFSMRPRPQGATVEITGCKAWNGKLPVRNNIPVRDCW